MRNITLAALMALSLGTAGISAAAASTHGEAALDKTVSTINQEASTSEGAKVVTDRLVKDFGVTERQVKDLQAKGLSFGEITVALSLAKSEPGGITDANIQKVLSLRQTTPPTGWGKVAKELGVKLGPAISRVEKLSKQSKGEFKKAEEKGETKAEEKAEKRENAEKAEKAEKAERAERPERSERAERPERPERPEKPEAAQSRH